MASGVLSSPWIVRFKAQESARFRLFCFPSSGGGPAAYRNWSEGGLGAMEVCALQLPGRGSRFSEPPFLSMRPLVSALSEALYPWLECPFAFWGHSMGALLAFETARALRRCGGPMPSRLLVGAYNAPHIPRAQAPLHDLPDEAFIAALRAYEGTPEEILGHAEMMSLLLPVLRADFSVCETYAYQAEGKLACPISVFAGRRDKATTPSGLAAWAEHTQGDCACHLFPGGHFFPQTHRALLLEQLRETFAPIAQELLL